jgi:hypothetical protein
MLIILMMMTHKEYRSKNLKGEHALKGKVWRWLCTDYGHPIKTKKHNIGTEEAPKMAIIGDYWDKETVTKLSTYSRNMRTCFPTASQK